MQRMGAGGGKEGGDIRGGWNANCKNVSPSLGHYYLTLRTAVEVFDPDTLS